MKRGVHESKKNNWKIVLTHCAFLVLSMHFFISEYSLICAHNFLFWYTKYGVKVLLLPAYIEIKIGLYLRLSKLVNKMIFWICTNKKHLLFDNWSISLQIGLIEMFLITKYNISRCVLPIIRIMFRPKEFGDRWHFTSIRELLFTSHLLMVTLLDIAPIFPIRNFH